MTKLVTVKLDYEQLKSDCRKSKSTIREISGKEVVSIQSTQFDGGIAYLYNSLTT